MTKKVGTVRHLEASGRGPVSLRIVEQTGERAHLELGVNYAEAEVPERSYYADYCEVRESRGGKSLIFGKLEPGTTRLRTKIEIVFPDEMFRIQLWGTSRDFHNTVRLASEKAVLSPIDRVEETEKVQTFRSNNVFMGMWGEDSVMDFYYLSPKDFHYVKRKEKTEIELQPVVRVAMPTALLHEFLERCRPFVEGAEQSQAEVD